MHSRPIPEKCFYMNLKQKNKLLHSRAGFGISLADYDNPSPIEAAVDGLFPQASPGPLEMITEQDWASNNPKAMKSVTDEMERKEKQKEFRAITKDMNVLWVTAMVNSNYPLLEKMALFWHGHFATHIDNPYFDQKLLHEFRINALGNFGDMLRAVSKSPAMLQFLNNQQNRKQHPNENFAREVMELFTLGRGNYTEDDIKEAARAFTGWAFDETGTFVVHERQHDDGEKLFLGEKGNFNGDDILNILLRQQQTAHFITRKIYRYLVSDEAIPEKRVNTLAREFYKSNYDIAALLRNIFTSDWFYSEETAGAKIKSPVELLVGYQRMLPMTFNNDNTLINLQRILGQYLFNPPNVAGWPGGRNWIDSSSLVIRMRLPEALLGTRELHLEAKDTDKEMHGNKPMAASTQPPRQFRVGRVEVHWNEYLAHWKQKPKETWPRELCDFLLPVAISEDALNKITTYADRGNDDAYLKSLTILIMELPEYQLS